MTVAGSGSIVKKVTRKPGRLYVIRVQHHRAIAANVPSMQSPKAVQLVNEAFGFFGNYHELT